MGYRQVVIKKADKMKLKDNNLVVLNNKIERKIPLEDINYIIIEDNKTVITTRLLSEISKYFISLIICDEKYEPSTITFSYNNHYKQLKTFKIQLSSTEELNGKLWKSIVRKKIENELVVLEMTSQEEYTIEKLKKYHAEVTNNDSTNREGLAAKMYFRSLFGSEFLRFYDDGLNSALNYGYAIIKSCVLRTLVKYGLNSFLGIHHKSVTNNFNLAYDLIEPYRAFVDHFLYQIQESLTFPLSFEIRKLLIDLLNCEVVCNNMHCTIEYSIDLLVKSYIKSLEENRDLLVFPSLTNDK